MPLFFYFLSHLKSGEKAARRGLFFFQLGQAVFGFRCLVSRCFGDYDAETACVCLPSSEEGRIFGEGGRKNCGMWLEGDLFSPRPHTAWELIVLLLFPTARKADPRARGRATPATGEREASPGSDGGVRAGSGAGGFTAAAILQVKEPRSTERALNPIFQPSLITFEQKE